jgi:hypothetical protein
VPETRINWRELESSDIAYLLDTAPPATSPIVTGFLDLHQYQPLLQSKRIVAWGGHPLAQYRRLGHEHVPAVAIWDISAVQMPELVRNSRQLRNQILRQGLEPADKGDIDWPSRMLAAVPELEIQRIMPGARQAQSWHTAAQAQRTTAAALRLDAAIAVIFHVSREEAKTAIEYGFVFLNWQPASKLTIQIKPGDQLVYRSKGRAAIVSLGFNDRSKRSIIDFELFPS